MLNAVKHLATFFIFYNTKQIISSGIIKIKYTQFCSFLKFIYFLNLLAILADSVASATHKMCYSAEIKVITTCCFKTKRLYKGSFPD